MNYFYKIYKFNTYPIITHSGIELSANVLKVVYENENLIKIV